ncbi:MAG: hypothetical protein LBB25_03990 [Holosporaceae bacterium]|jgi:cell division transport system permease protein|nr:hypothetical protein [Holosporaceae bacterium]
MSFFNFNRDYDFDFFSDKSNRFVPIIVGFLMYTATISIMSSIFIYNLTSGWKNALNGHITIEFQSNINGVDEILTEGQNEKIMEIIKSTEGIKFVKKLQETDILEILEPWLSSTAIPDDFPFPSIFDVETEKNTKVDIPVLLEKLSKVSKSVKIHDHANWYATLVKISNGLFSFAIVLSLLIFITVCATMIFITKKALSIHRNTVKILQLVGANNFYIASQFRWYYFIVGCKSSLISVLGSIITIVGIFFIYADRILHPDIFRYALSVIIVPLTATMLIIITSKKAVLFFLKNDKWTN